MAFAYRVWGVMKSRLISVALGIKKVVWDPFVYDSEIYTKRLKAAKEEEENKAEVLQEVLDAKTELQGVKDNNAKLRGKIKKVGRKY